MKETILMAINLTKNQGIKLTKEVAGVTETLKKIKLGCGWEASKSGYVDIPVTKEVKKRRGGFFGFGGTVTTTTETVIERKYVGEIDIDASVFAFKNGRLVGECTYRNQTLLNRGGKVIAKSSGDNRQGSTGKNDDETITVNMLNIGDFADTLYLALNIYGSKSNGQRFNMVKNAYVRVCDDKGVEIAHFDLSEDYSGKTGVIVGKIHSVNGAFQFTALGDGVRVNGLGDLAKQAQTL